jgi:Zn-dependent protease
VLLFSVVAHEYAHAEAAYRQGDDTAYLLGRLTLNPLKHIDPFMTILLPLLLYVSHAGFLFGGAKPVPVDPRKYRDYRRGDIIVSLAGIAVNLALYVVSAALFALVGLVASAIGVRGVGVGVAEVAQRMLVYGMLLNLVLAFFNLIPLPPLDGSHVLAQLLPPGAAAKYQLLYKLGFIPILILVWLLPGVVQVLMWPALRLMDFALSLVGRFAVSPALFPR